LQKKPLGWRHCGDLIGKAVFVHVVHFPFSLSPRTVAFEAMCMTLGEMGFLMLL
jgi:hypothetical protein